MKRAVLFLLFLSLPAGAQAVRPAPAQPVPLIQQQPPSYPGATYTPVGAGASHGGLAAPRPAVERSKNTRLVPPEPDGAPGMWAADGDPALKASADTFDWKILDVTLPAPDVDDPGFGLIPAQICVSRLGDVLDTSWPINRAVVRLTWKQRACLFAGLYRWCAEEVHKHTSVGTPSHEDARATVATAAAFKKKMCSEELVTDEVRALAAQIRTKWKWVTK